MIKVGDKIPNMKLKFLNHDGMEEVSTQDLFKSKKIVLVGIPGAFTPTCHSIHLQGFLAKLPEFRNKGIDLVVFTSVNDIFVLKAWAESTGALGKLAFLADGNGDFARALGLDMDVSSLGMGVRSQRYDMLVYNGVVHSLVVESSAGACSVTHAASFLETL